MIDSDQRSDRHRSSTTRNNLVVEFHASALFEGVDEFKHTHTLTSTNIEDFY